MDRVQVLKRESADLGGDGADEAEYDSPIEPQEDALEAAGLFLQEAAARDQQVLIDRSAGNIRFKDTANPTPRSLTDIVTGPLIAHKTLRHLVHFIQEGPAEGFASGAYKEVLPAGNPYFTSVIWYVDSSKAQKIVETTVTRNETQLPTQIVWKMYAPDGTTVLSTVTDAITYTNNIESTRTRTIA